MTLNEIVQAGVWLFLVMSIVYAHLSYRKLRKVIFNDMKHLLSSNTGQGTRDKGRKKGESKHVTTT